MHARKLVLGLLVGATALAAGPVSLIADGRIAAPAQIRGSWGDGGVHLVDPAPGHMDLVAFDAPVFYDGTVAATVDLADKPYVTVLTRVHRRTSPVSSGFEGTSGVGLTVREKYVRFDRWDDGVTLPLGARAWAGSRLGGRTVRVEVIAEGETLTGRVLDPTSGAVLVTLTVRDPGSGTGGAGVRMQDDRVSRVLRLEASPADPEDRGIVAGDANAPIGERRFLLMSGEEATRATARGHADLGVWPYDDRGLHGVVVPAEQVGPLRAGGLTFEERQLVPYWAVDPDVRSAARKVPLDDGWPVLTASFKDPDMVEQVLDAWVAKRPDIARKTLLTVSHGKRPVWALRISDHPDKDEDEPAVLITGAMHGSELASTEYALDAAERLLKGHGSDPAATRQVDGLDLWVVPLVNPDGNHHVHTVTRFGGRKNGRQTWASGGNAAWGGVDLNRNFPFGFGRDEGASRSFPNSAYYRGPEPLSEPESQAIAQLARQRHFAAALSFHTNASMILVPYTLDGVEQPTPNAPWAIAEGIAAVTPEQPNGKALRVRKQIYPVDGTDQDWLRHSFGTTAFIVEGSHHNPEERPIRLATVAALRPVIPALLDRVLDGPRLTVHAVDEAGKPVVARIDVDTEVLNAGEVWTSRAGDGRHDRLLAAPGTVTVTASAEGYQAARQQVRVDGVAEVRLVLKQTQ